MYSATGQKLQAYHKTATTTYQSPIGYSSEVPTNKKTDYVGNKIYEDDELVRILVDGGYYDVKAEKYYFYVQDHLGNNRLVVDQDGGVVQQTHYYPFGSAFADSKNEDTQPYKYNGKELDKMHELNLYDYSARHYDAAIGRFTTIDPRTEDYYEWSPYVYVGNNPIKRTDPDGEAWINVFGAIANAALDYGSQVATNMASGKGFKEALTHDINVGSIVVSAGEGFLNPIGATTKNIAKTTVKTVVRNVVSEGAKGAAGQMLDNVIKGENLTKDVGVSTVTSAVTGNMKVTPNSNNANKTISKANTKTTANPSTGRGAGTLTKGEQRSLNSAKSEKTANIGVEVTTSAVANTTGNITTNALIDDKKKKP